MTDTIRDSLLSLSTNKPRLVFWLMLIITLLFAAQIPRIEIDTDPENMLPETNQERIFHNSTKTMFNMHDSIVVGAVNNQHSNGIYNAKSLAALHQLTENIKTIDGVILPDLMSLSMVDNITQEEQGAIRFEWMMAQPPQNQDDANQVKNHVSRLPLLFDTLVSRDNKAASIYVPIQDKNQSYAISEKIRAFVQQLDSDDEWHITGLPVAEDRFGYEMFVQMGISAPLAGLMIFVVMWYFFRNIPLITAPMIVAMATVIITMGLLIGLGFTVHIMSSMIAIFLMPIAVVDSVHIMSEFADRHKPGNSSRDTITVVMKHLFKPMMFTSITSTVGFLSLMLTPIPPVQIFGAHVGFGIMLAFLLTIIFIPAYVVCLKPETLERLTQNMPDEENSRLARSLKVLGIRADANAKLWIMGFTAVLAISIYGISLININDNPVRWFKTDHELRVADRVLNHHFAGTYNAHLVLNYTGDSHSQVAELITQYKSKQSLSLTTQNWLAGLDSSSQEELLFAIDDKLFELESEEAEVIGELMTAIEEVQTSSRYFTQPKTLAYIEGLQQALLASGLLGKSNSLADVVKVVNRELRSGQQQDYQLPATSNAVAQTLLQYQSSHRPQDLWHFVTPDYRNTLIWLQLTSGDNQDITAVVELVEQYLIDNPLPAEISINWAGKAYLNVVWQKAMVEGMLDSLISAFVIVFVMMVLLFRSFIYGLLAMLPLSFTITLIYGLIGWVGKDYDMPIAVLSALTLGLSVDFAIHFLQRSRELIAETGSVHQAMQLIFSEPARAISRNALVIAIGFTPLLFAPLVPYITVGIFLASIMAISALVTLIMLPAVMETIKTTLTKAS